MDKIVESSAVRLTAVMVRSSIAQTTLAVTSTVLTTGHAQTPKFTLGLAEMWIFIVIMTTPVRTSP
jgi:hypothetical protein